MSLCQVELNKLENRIEDLKNKGFNPSIIFDPRLAEQDYNKYKAYNSINENEDRFFIKSFLFSPSINLNDWGVTLDSLPRYIWTFKNMPVVLTEDFGHPDNGKKFDTLDNTLNYQEGFRVGTIIDIVYEKGIYYAISEITDKKAKQMFKDNKVPLFVSPAIAFTEQTIRKNNWRGLHLAIVDRPAFTTQKAIIKGICEGTYDLCSVQLGTASIEKDATIETILEFSRENTLNRYLENIKKIQEHNIINFNSNFQTFSNDKTEMVEENTQKQENVSNANPVTEHTKSYGGLDMCVAQFLERGLDANTAREICTIAIGSTGGNGGFGGENPTQNGGGGNGSFSENEKAYVATATVIKKIKDDNLLLSTKVNQYESKLKENGIQLESFETTIKKWKEEKEKAEIDVLRRDLTDFLKKYKKSEDEIKTEVEEYIKHNMTLTSLQNIYKSQKTLEETEKLMNESNDSNAKPNEILDLKNGEVTNVTSTNDTIQKATAKTNVSAHSLLIEMFTPFSNEKEGE